MTRKRKTGGMTGLSRFVAVLNDQASTQPPLTSSSSAVSGTVIIDNQAPSGLTDERASGEESSAGVDESVSQAKRVRRESEALLGEQATGKGRYDASGLVPYYQHISQVPEHLQKYFSQRKRFFSLYDSPPGCMLDEEGWYSVTPERIADQIAERCRCDTVLDAFCGVGGNTIAFARTCERVIAIDTNATRLALARHNAQIYGVAERIEFIQADYIAFARAHGAGGSESTSPKERRKIDVVFLSPPWGGPSYLSSAAKSTGDDDNAAVGDNCNTSIHSATAHPSYSLSSIQPVHGKELFDLTRRITPNVAFYLPRNTNLTEISDLLNDDTRLPGEQVEVEEEWMGSKLKALTCYFGGLARGQENLF